LLALDNLVVVVVGQVVHRQVQQVVSVYRYQLLRAERTQQRLRLAVMEMQVVLLHQVLGVVVLGLLQAEQLISVVVLVVLAQFMSGSRFSYGTTILCTT
jgi:hypothetical protein